MSGKLLLVATPIGNLGDISKRTIEALSSADIVLAEDTRVSVKIMNHLGLKKKLISCHAHNEKEVSDIVIRAGRENLTLALLSDAGTPLISDPGHILVGRAIASNLEIVPIPGPSAFILALIASGLPTDRFVFEGFLPDKANDIKEHLQSLKNEPRTLIFYVAPHKLEKTLAALNDELGDREACLARELTKLHETFLRKTLPDLLHEVKRDPPRGECVLVVRGKESEAGDGESPEEKRRSLEMYVRENLERGAKATELASVAAREFGMKRSEVYRFIVDYQARLREQSKQCDN